MLTALTTPLRPLHHRLDQARPYVLGAAWFFVAFSLVQLAWVVSTKWGDPAGLTSLYMATTTTGETIHPWGLGYEGMLGLLVACVQFSVVGTAAIMSVLPTLRWRRLGHGVLIGWAGLWMLGLMKFAGADPAFDSFGAAALSSVLFASTVYRALPRKRPAETPVATVEFDLGFAPESEPQPASRRARAITAARRLGARALRMLDRSVQRVKPAAQKAARHARNAALTASRKVRNSVPPPATSPD